MRKSLKYNLYQITIPLILIKKKYYIYPNLPKCSIFKFLYFRFVFSTKIYSTFLNCLQMLNFKNQIFLIKHIWVIVHTLIHSTLHTHTPAHIHTSRNYQKLIVRTLIFANTSKTHYQIFSMIPIPTDKRKIKKHHFAMVHV